MPVLGEVGAGEVPDPRHLSRGLRIPGQQYCDQPYVVKTEDGAWLLAMTTAQGHEGSATQNIVTYRTTDQGRTWSKPVWVEPPGGPEASYAVMVKAATGRVYCFYNHNTDNVREVRREDRGVYSRVDSLGHYVFRYSDDHGRTWSRRRYEVPVREFDCDSQNVYGGKLRFFWNVGRPLVLSGIAGTPTGVLLTLHKVGAMGNGFFAQSEGAFLYSPNLLQAREAADVTFETLPEGRVGLRTPPSGGRIAEEQCVTQLSDGSLFCVYRTVDGYPAYSQSRDGGRRWTEPRYLAYAPGGRRIKHPRAANFLWRCANGKYLYWFHNHGGALVRKKSDWDPYADRNPVWICAAEERRTPQGLTLEFSQPEILLYDDDPYVRMSYPDLIEEAGRFWITETQKNLGRVHEVPARLLASLWEQPRRREVAREGMLLDREKPPVSLPAPKLPKFLERDASRPDYGTKVLRTGFSVELQWRAEVAPGQVLVDGRTPAGAGLRLETAERGRLRLLLGDGRENSVWESDVDTLRPGQDQHLVVTVDGGPRIITWVIDGQLQDGGDERQFGWGRFSPTLREANGAPEWRVGKGVHRLRVYGRPLLTGEAVGNWRAAEKPGT